MWIIDPDDYLPHKDALLIINKAYIEKSGLELLVFGYNKQALKRKAKIISIKEYKYCNGEELLSMLCMHSKFIEGFTWNKVFNLKLLKNKIGRFDISISSFEDKVWLFPLVADLNSCLIIPDILYQYNYNPTSLSRNADINKTIRRYDDAYDAHKKILEYIIKKYSDDSSIYYSVLADTYGIVRNNLMHKKQFIANHQRQLISEYSNFLHTTWKVSGNKKYFYFILKVLRYIKESYL